MPFAELQFRELLEAAPDAVVISNEKGEIVHVNRQVERLFGYDRIELIGQPVEILMPPDFRDRHFSHRQHFFKDPRVRSMGVGLELHAMRKDGMRFPVEISLSPLQTETSQLVSASIRDITDRKKLEQKFRSLLDSAPDATVIVTKDGIIHMINRQTENLFGYTREEIVGKRVEILIPQELRDRHVQHRSDFASAAHLRPMGMGIELHAVKKDGTTFPVEISLSPLETEEGLLVTASVRDISHRKNLETELRKKSEEIEAFTYSVSHDLRAPLRGIIGFTTILEEEYINKLDDEAKRLTGIIKKSTEKMGHLIDDLLRFSRLGKQEIIKTKISTKILVDEVINELMQNNPQGKIDWVIETLPDMRGDHNTFRQVWINLISNAIKYSGGHLQPKITIGSFHKEDKQVFFVKDNGVGFDDKYRHKLFKVFQRLHSEEEFKGTGVGLALVEKIISKHNGSIWAHGKVGEGASFFFSVPD